MFHANETRHVSNSKHFSPSINTSTQSSLPYSITTYISNYKYTMAASSLTLALLLSLILFHTCSGVQIGLRRLRLHNQNECQIRRIDAREPDRKVASEAGVTEIWDENDDQFRCAGVAAVRHTIEQRGLLLPAYSNAPKLIYVDQGRGYHGAAIPGCPETYQSEEEPGSRRDPRQGSRDEHQKVRKIREGDIIAIPAGVADWFYNDAQSPLVLVQILDTSNSDNQLDQNFRKFFLAGNPQRQIQGQRRVDPSSGYRESTRRGQEQQQRSGNIFEAFDEQLLAEAFNIDTDLARRIKSQNDNRGIIVRVEEQLQFLSPEFSQQEEREFRGSSSRYTNGIEETYCTAQLKQNTNDPSRADIFNPRAGRLTNVNGFTLPILRYLQLSAQKGHLYRNAIMAPHWNMNAHSINYITRGEWADSNRKRERGECVQRASAGRADNHCTAKLRGSQESRK
ncbi:Cocosin 1 [Linum grandiflorum]